VKDFPNVNVFPIALATAVLLSGCSALNEKFSGDKVDYRGKSTQKSVPLDVPPDLTPLPSDNRYQPPGSAAAGAINASNYAAPGSAPAAAPAPVVAPSSVGDVRVERQGNLRWLSTSATPEQLWPRLQEFWEERKLPLVSDKPELGTMETEWAENRAKLPENFLRRALGKVVDSLYSSGELDKFRLRLERTPSGSEIYLIHRGFEEVYANNSKDATVWQPRVRDPQLEAEMLSLLMRKLGTKPEQVSTELAKAEPSVAPKARVTADAAVLQLDEPLERAWRKVGMALDRSGFTVEDRDRTQGLYFVRYVDPASSGREEPGLWSKWFGDKKKNDKAIARYRIQVKTEANNRSLVAVFDESGGPEKGEAGVRIAKLLVDELK
jgi:outer membrane protein assembly factor BamC